MINIATQSGVLEFNSIETSVHRRVVIKLSWPVALEVVSVGSGQCWKWSVLEVVSVWSGQCRSIARRTGRCSQVGRQWPVVWSSLSQSTFPWSHVQAPFATRQDCDSLCAGSSALLKGTAASSHSHNVFYPSSKNVIWKRKLQMKVGFV